VDFTGRHAQVYLVICQHAGEAFDDAAHFDGGRIFDHGGLLI